MRDAVKVENLITRSQLKKGFADLNAPRWDDFCQPALVPNESLKRKEAGTPIGDYYAQFEPRPPTEPNTWDNTRPGAKLGPHQEYEPHRANKELKRKRAQRSLDESEGLDVPLHISDRSAYVNLNYPPNMHRHPIMDLKDRPPELPSWNLCQQKAQQNAQRIRTERNNEVRRKHANNNNRRKPNEPKVLVWDEGQVEPVQGKHYDITLDQTDPKDIMYTNLLRDVVLPVVAGLVLFLYTHTVHPSHHCRRLWVLSAVRLLLRSLATLCAPKGVSLTSVVRMRDVVYVCYRVVGVVEAWDVVYGCYKVVGVRVDAVKW